MLLQTLIGGSYGSSFFPFASQRERDRKKKNNSGNRTHFQSLRSAINLKKKVFFLRATTSWSCIRAQDGPLQHQLLTTGLVSPFSVGPHLQSFIARPRHIGACRGDFKKASGNLDIAILPSGQSMAGPSPRFALPLLPSRFLDMLAPVEGEKTRVARAQK